MSDPVADLIVQWFDSETTGTAHGDAEHLIGTLRDAGWHIVRLQRPQDAP